MSFVTGTGTELLYVSTAQGTAKASFTTEVGINDTAGMGEQASLPPFFFGQNPYGIGKTIRIFAAGILSSTATPTYTFTCRLGGAAAITGPIILGSAALTTGSGVSNQFWEFEGRVTMRTLGAAGANSTAQGVGVVRSSGLAVIVNPLWGGAASPGTVATVDNTIANYINFDVACSANSASNTITLQYLAVEGSN